MNVNDINKLKKMVEAQQKKSAWKRGICEYALELLESLKDSDFDVICNKRMFLNGLLNGAVDWNQYSWGGCSLIYDCDIAERLCTQSELKKTDGGRKQPNKRESWLDVQARALNQACDLLLHLFGYIAITTK